MLVLNFKLLVIPDFQKASEELGRRCRPSMLDNTVGLPCEGEMLGLQFEPITAAC